MSVPFFVPRLGSISVFLLKLYSSHQQPALVFISDPSLFLKPPQIIKTTSIFIQKQIVKYPQ